MPRPANTAVLQQLRKKILSGAFNKTTFLPPERQLASEYQVGRAIIRGALRSLGDEKIIYKVPNRGWRVSSQEECSLKRIILRLPGRMNTEGYEGMGLVAGICSGANNICAEVILSAPPRKLKKEELQERFNAGDIQGIIFLESAPDISIPDLLKCGIPCVVANQEEDLQLPCARMDYRAIGRMAGQELLRRGYRKAAVSSGSQERFIYRELLAGFRGALAEENIFLDSCHIFCGEKGSSGKEIARLLQLPAAQRPEVFFTLRDYRAELVCRIAEEYGLKIPEDLGVISYDDISWPAAASRGLTTIKEDVSQIGEEAVRMLREMYESGCQGVANSFIPGELVERTSLTFRCCPDERA